MKAGFVVCTLLALGVLATSEYNYWQSRKDVAELSQRLNVQRQLQSFATALVDAETGQRGYLLTGDDRYLEPYRRATARLSALSEKLGGYYQGDAQGQALLSQVTLATNAKLTELDLTIRMRRQGQLGAVGDAIATDVGREKMDAARAGITALIDHEEGRRWTVAGRWERMRDAARYAIALASLLVVVAFFFVMRQSVQVTREREVQRRALQAERDALDATVDRRTEELVRLASHLQSSREDERAKLARELHDELGAVLTAAKLDVAWMGAKLKGADPALVAKLQALKSVLETGIQLKRRIIEDLRPSLLSNLGLVPALERLVEEHRQRTSGRVTSDIDSEIDLPEDMALVIYRIAQEALTNVQKYASASSVHVALRRLPNHLELRVSDDGAGFEPTAVSASRQGLAGMRHRLMSIRGALQVDSAPGRGTVITARVPLDEVEAAQARALAVETSTFAPPPPAFHDAYADARPDEAGAHRPQPTPGARAEHTEPA